MQSANWLVPIRGSKWGPAAVDFLRLMPTPIFGRVKFGEPIDPNEKSMYTMNNIFD